MKKTLLFLLLSNLCHAQTILSGVITTPKKQPIEGVNIGIVGSYDGTSSEKDGTFRFETDAKGEVVIAVSFVGYVPQKKTIKIGDEKEISIDFSMNEAITDLESVTVKAQKIDLLAKNSLISLKPLELRAMGGTNADIAAGFRTMPGVQSTTDATGLFVRGGTGEETKVFIDGMVADNFFYAGSPDVSQRSRFSPELFAGNFFSSGGYSALYGQALSSTLILETNGVPLKSTFGGSISSIGATAETNKIIIPEKLSVGGVINYSNLAPYYQVVPQNRDFTTGPKFLDGMVHGKYQWGQNNILRFLASSGTNQVGFEETLSKQTRTFKLNSQNQYSSLNYSGKFLNVLSINTGLSWSKINNSYALDTIFTNTVKVPSYSYGKGSNEESIHTRLVASYIIRPMFDIYVGGEYFYTKSLTSFSLAERSIIKPTVGDNLTATFAESNLKVSNFRLRAGIRGDYSTLLSEWRWSPRLNATYHFNATTKAILSYGVFYQRPSFDYLVNQPETLKFQRADHWIMNIQKEVGRTIFRAEIFNKDYKNLIRTQNSDTTSDGHGYARGFELFWREKGLIRNVDFWASYSYLDTKRLFLNYPIETRPNFAAKHTFVLAGKTFIPKITTSIGLTYTYSSGRPYYNPFKGKESFLSDYTPAYNNLGATVAYLNNFLKSNSILVFSVNNILGSQQIFGYKIDSAGNKQAVMPLAPRFFYLGLFFNWGIDKRQNTVDNLLN